VSSAISCIVIKSDRRPRKVPILGETVRVYGKTDLFVVMNVDRNRRVAQLMERGGKHRLVNVPFASVQMFKHNLSQTIHRFLEAREEAKAEESRPHR
jgi:hypothetical protein